MWLNPGPIIVSGDLWCTIAMLLMCLLVKLGR